MHKRSAILLLNLAHAVDHMFLLIFATAVATIAADFGFARWEDLMPFGVGAFVMFGLGSLPSGRLGDLWGRRAMMVVFFFGIGASSLLASLAQGPWQLAAALTLIGSFASIYHPVGIPMLLQGASRPGATIGINGLAGNLGMPWRPPRRDCWCSGWAGAPPLQCPAWSASRSDSCSCRWCHPRLRRR
jgi:MFS family permease